MTKSDQLARIDGVDVGEISVNLLGPTPSINVKYAYVNSTTGEKFGAGTRLQWSDTTLAKLVELISAMEKDICVHVFGDAIVQTDVTTRLPTEVPQDDEIPSL